MQWCPSIEKGKYIELTYNFVKKKVEIACSDIHFTLNVFFQHLSLIETRAHFTWCLSSVSTTWQVC